MVAKSDIPLCSATRGLQARANYWDAYEVQLASHPPSALHAYLEFATRTPKWIDALMTVRNATVRLLSLKDVGKLASVPPPSAATSLGVGDRVGIFTIRSVCEQELVLEIIDSHLDVVLSVYKHEGAAARLTVSTWCSIITGSGRSTWCQWLPCTGLSCVRFCRPKRYRQKQADRSIDATGKAQEMPADVMRAFLAYRSAISARPPAACANSHTSPRSTG